MLKYLIVRGGGLLPNCSSFKPIHQSTILDRTDDFARGLIGAWIFNEQNSSVIYNRASVSLQGRATMQTTPAWSGSQWGSALKFVAGNSDYALIPNFPGFRPTTYPFCIAARVFMPAGNVVIWTNDDVFNKYSGITLVSDDGHTFALRLGDNGTIGSTHRKDLLTSTSVNANHDEWVSIAYSVNSISSFEAYTNGWDNTGSTSGTASSLAYNGTAPLNGSMGREDISSLSAEYYSSHTIDYIYFWTGRTLSSQEAFELHVDPYRMFENTSRAKLYVFPGWHVYKLNDIASSDIANIQDISRFSVNKIMDV